MVPHAAQVWKIEQGRIVKRQDGDGSRQTAKAGRRDRAEQGRAQQQKGQEVMKKTKTKSGKGKMCPGCGKSMKNCTC